MFILFIYVIYVYFRSQYNILPILNSHHLIIGTRKFKEDVENGLVTRRTWLSEGIFGELKHTTKTCAHDANVEINLQIILIKMLLN